MQILSIKRRERKDIIEEQQKKEKQGLYNNPFGFLYGGIFISGM